MARWVENPYWQYLYGKEYFSHQLPIDPLQLTRFHNSIGESGCEFLLSLTITVGVQTKTVMVNVDTTTQEKATAFPTDARLYHKARRSLISAAKGMSIELRHQAAPAV